MRFLLVMTVAFVVLTAVNLYSFLLRNRPPGRPVPRNAVVRLAGPDEVTGHTGGESGGAPRAYGGERYPLREWCGADLDPRELEAARALIGDAVPDSLPVRERMVELGAYLLERLDDKRGTPSSRMQAASPLETYRLAIAGESGIWCSNFAVVYYLFANACGISTRRVALMEQENSGYHSRHALCESYVPEQGRWACVDLNSRLLMVMDGQQLVLNTIDLADAGRIGFHDMRAVVYTGGSTIETEYVRVADRLGHYLGAGTLLVYRLPERSTNDLTRYLRRSRALIIADHAIASDYPRRVVLFWLWIAGAIAVAAAFSRRRMVKQRKGAR